MTGERGEEAGRRVQTGELPPPEFSFLLLDLLTLCVLAFLYIPCASLKWSKEEVRIPGTRVTDVLSHCVDAGN